MPMVDAAQFRSLLERLESQDVESHPSVERASERAIVSSDGIDAGVHELCLGILALGTTLHAAQGMHRRLLGEFVDLNEVRVASVRDIEHALSERPTSRREERAQRLRCVLADLHSREQSLTLRAASSMPASELSEYLDSLDGQTPYASSRAQLLHLGISCVPLDDRSRTLLSDARVLDARCDCTQGALALGEALRGQACRGWNAPRAALLVRVAGEHAGHASKPSTEASTQRRGARGQRGGSS